MRRIRRTTIRPRLAASALILAAALAARVGRADTFYVDGAAAAGGDGSTARPFSDIQTGVNAGKPGDTVVVRAGTYDVRTPINVGVKGTSAEPFVIRGEGAVTLRDPSRSIQPLHGVLTVSGGTYTTVSGLKVDGSGAIGIFVINGDHVVVEDNVTTDSWGSGIYAIYSTNVTIRRNDISGCSEGATGAQECLDVADTDGFDVSYNEVHHNHVGKSGGEGIDVKMGAANGSVHHNKLHDLVRVGLYVDAWDKLTSNIDLYANEIFHDNSGIGIASENGGTVHDVRVHDNLIYENGVNYSPVSPDWTSPGGIGIWVPNDAGDPPREDVHIYNNTIVRNAGSKTWGIGIQIASNHVPGLVVRNNILGEHVSDGIDVTSTANIENVRNLTFPYTHQSWTHESPGTDFLDMDPRFVDSNGLNFHLAAGSPAIDSGEGTLIAATDFDGNVRVVGASVDLGAFEFGSTRAPNSDGGGTVGPAGTGGQGSTGGPASTSGGAAGTHDNASGRTDAGPDAGRGGPTDTDSAIRGPGAVGCGSCRAAQGSPRESEWLFLALGAALWARATRRRRRTSRI